MADKAAKKYRKKKNKFWKKYKVDRHADFWEKRFLKDLNFMSLVYNDKKAKKLWYTNLNLYYFLSCIFAGWI